MSNEQDSQFVRNFILVIVILAVFGIIAAVMGRHFATGEKKDVYVSGALEKHIAPAGEDNTNPKAHLYAAIPMGAAPETAPAEPAKAPAAAAPAKPAASAGSSAPSTAAAAPAPSASAGAGTSTASTAGVGKHIYSTVCFACHATGVAGAPKFGNKDAWAPRIAQGKATLYKHALNGFMAKGGGMMPPKGGRTDLSDAQVKAAVDYMVSAAK